INQIDTVSAAIAGAVEQQSATISEVGHNMNAAARGSTEIAQNVAGVARAAGQTSTGAGEVERAASELAEIAVELRGLVSSFKYNSEVRGGARLGPSASSDPVRGADARRLADGWAAPALAS